MSIENLWLASGGVFLLVCLAVFSLRQLSSGRYHHPRVQKDGGSVFFGGTYFMDFAYWLFSPVAKALVILKVSPNQISLGCLLVSIAAGVSFGRGEFALAGWIWLLGSAMDALDGLVARSQEKANPAGAVIDSTVDRVAELSVFFGLAFYYRGQPYIMLAAFLALAGSVLTSYISAKGEILNIKLPRGVMRRAERAVYVGAAALLSPLLAAHLEAGAERPLYHLMIFVLLLIAFFSLLSSGYRVWWLCRELNQNKSQ